MKRIMLLKHRGISSYRLNFGMVLLALLVSAAMFWAMQQTSKLYENNRQKTEEMISLRQSASDMQVASDYLTEQIRCFTITGEKKYFSNYLNEVYNAKRREKALVKLGVHLGSTEAYLNLKSAMQDSVDLMEREYYAARLTMEAYGIDPEKFEEEFGEDFSKKFSEILLTAADSVLTQSEMAETAREMLFDETYREKKAQISEHMQNCLEVLLENIEEEQSATSAKLKRQVVIEHVLTGLLIIILLGIVWITSVLVFKPLRSAVAKIREEKDIPLKGAYEIRFLAKTYNLMYHKSLESREKLEYDATHDKLTGLYNRRGYDFLLQNVDLDTSALLLMDLDKFKQINDTYGHDVGDKVLEKVAKVLHKNFRAQDYVCRLGGDEFAVIMIHAEEELSGQIRDKIQLINEELKVPEEGMPPISLSAGVVFGDSDHDAENIYKDADGALYQAKENGRCDISFHMAS